MNRRELLLQEMGIPLWQLTKPAVLQGIGDLAIPSDIHTLILADEQQFSQQPLLQDLLRASDSLPQRFITIGTDKLARVESQHTLLIFCAAMCHTALLASPLAQQKHRCIALPANLQLTPTEKRQIWQQIQQFLSRYGQ